MEITTSSLTDGIIYRANIFNYDIGYLNQIRERSIKLDLNLYKTKKNEKGDESLVDINTAMQFLNLKSKDQLQKILGFLSERESDDNDDLSGDLGKMSLISYRDARSTLLLLVDVIFFSKNELHRSESKRLEGTDKLEVDEMKSRQYVRNAFSDNILYALLYLDGLIMFNVDIIRCISKVSPLVGVNLHNILFEILNEKYLDEQTKEVASHLLSAELSFVNPDIISNTLWKNAINWTYNYYVQRKRENCFTSNLSLILTVDSSVDLLLSHVDHGKKMVLELFDFMTKSDSNYNIIYEALFCVWNISNNKNTLKLFEVKHDKYVEKIVQVIKTNKIDKIVRIGLMTIKNLLDSTTCMEILLDLKFMKAISTLLMNKWNDPLIKEHLNSVYDYLEKNYKIMNSFEKYMKELESGDIKWGALHTTPFWEENYKEFESNNFMYIEMLCKILQNPNILTDHDIEMKCVACFDLGEFVRLYPGGAVLLEDYGAKDSLLYLIQHNDLELKNRALVCLQKIMMRSLKR